MKNKDTFKIIFLFFIFSFFSPLFSYASTLYFDSSSSDIYKGDTFVVTAKISSSDNFINAVDGLIIFDKNKLEVKNVSAGNSVFSLWMQNPVFSNESGEIKFIGGAPNGFQGKEGEIIKIIFLGKENGSASISFKDNLVLFLNDGKGTKVFPETKPLSLSILTRPDNIVSKDEWQDVLSKDNTPPEPFEIEIAKSPFLFDDKYFISFFTTDSESGVKYFEVKEGDQDFIKTESPYELMDQSLKSPIFVKAIDNAGNERLIGINQVSTTTVTKFYKAKEFWLIILGAIVLVFLLIIVKIKKRHKDEE